MKKVMKKLISLILVMVLSVSFALNAAAESYTLSALTGQGETSADGSLQDDIKREIPVRTFTSLQEDNAQYVSSMLTGVGDEAYEDGFFYSLLGDNTAVITGYNGTTENVVVPYTVGDARVVAIKAGAFASEIRSISIHGNVMYIEDGAIPAGCEISSWQGSYAATWAQQNGYELNSLTKGILFENVYDMTDALDHMSVLSNSLISTGITEAKRLEIGDTFILNHGEEEQFFTLTGKRNIGVRVYLTVKSAELKDIFSYRVYQGIKSVTKTFSNDMEVGVNLEEEDISAASEVFEQAPVTTETSPKILSVSPPTKIAGMKLEVSFEQVKKVTTAYRVVVDNGEISSGNMTTDEEDQNTVKIKANKKYGKKNFVKDGFSGMTEAEQKEMIDFMAQLRGEEKGEPLGSFFLMICPELGFGLEFSVSFSFEIGGTGTMTWTENKITLYEYDKDDKAWGYVREVGTSSDKSVSGTVYGKAGISASVKVICLFVTSALQIKGSAEGIVELLVPSDPHKCEVFKIGVSIKLTIETGFWLSAGGWEYQLASAEKVTFTIADKTPVEVHRNFEQGLHNPWECAYTPIEYSFRFVTGIENWQPDSFCYLDPDPQKKVYTLKSEGKAFSLSASGLVKKDYPGIKSEYIDFDYSKHPDALEWIPTFEKPKNSTKSCIWYLKEPAPLDSYPWDESKTVKVNLETATGKTFDRQDDLPETITLEAQWDSKCKIDYDANGGRFDESAGAVGDVLSKYYVKNTKPGKLYVTPKKELAKFQKWSLDPLGDEDWDENDEITEDLHLYAQYEIFDPTDHYSVNTRYGSSPTLIGTAQEQKTGQVDWVLLLGQFDAAPDFETLDYLLQNGINNYVNSEEGRKRLAFYMDSNHQNVIVNYSQNPDLLNCKGRVIFVEDNPVAITLTGLVDPSIIYNEFTIPSTINGLPVVAESGMLQKLKAKKVFFGKAAAGNIQNTETDQELFKDNTDVHEVYMDTTTIINLSDKAFSGCTNLAAVSLPKTLQQIGKEAFKDCIQLGEATIGMQVDTIGEHAFDGCANLNTVNINTPFMQSMSRAFEDQDNDIEAHIKLELGENVIILPKNAFYSCSALKSIEVDRNKVNNLKEIEDYAFKNCSGLVNMPLEDWDKLSIIGESAFEGCEGLTELKIPDSVESYGKNMIRYCTGIKTLELGLHAPVDVDITTENSRGGHPLYIGIGSELETIKISDGITEIGDRAFANCYAHDTANNGYFIFDNITGFPKLTTIISASTSEFPSKLTRIGEDAFEGSILQTDLRFTEAITIENNAFSSISGITSLEFTKGGTIGAHAFYRCYGLSSVKLGKVTSIGDGAFTDCASIEKLTIPNSVEHYGINMINGCVGIKTLSLGMHAPVNENLTKDNTIGGAPFYIGYGSQLQKLILANGITEIGDYALTNCYSHDENHNGYYQLDCKKFDQLTEVVFPNTIKRIGKHAFEGSNIKNDLLSFPKGIEIGEYAFQGITGIGGLEFCGESSIGRGAFKDCEGLMAINLNSQVSVIEEYAFSGCSALQTIDLKGVNKVGESAFEDCASLKSLAFPNSVNDYGKNMIRGCTGLTTLELGIHAPVNVDVTSENSRGGHPLYIGSGSKLKKVILAEGITGIGANALANAYSHDTYNNNNYYLESIGFGDLTEVKLPKSLKRVGSDAFKGSKLSGDLKFWEFVTIEDNAFSNLEGVTSLETVKGGTIGTNAFYRCYGLTSVKLGNVTSIGDGAFMECDKLKELTIPDTVQYYGNNMINSCSSIETLSVGKNAPVDIDLTSGNSIGGHPLFIDNGSALRYLVLADGITRIGNYSFANCYSHDPYNNHQYYLDSRGFDNLKIIQLPTTLIEIGDYAFDRADGITKVWTGPNLNSIGSNAFGDSHPTFYALPDTKYNEWLADWCEENGYIYVYGNKPFVRLSFEYGTEEEDDEGEISAASITEVEAFSRIDEPPVPEREGYTFLGWFAPGSAEPWDFSSDRVGAYDLTLTAQWIKNTINGLYRIEGDHAVLVSYSLAEDDSTAVVLPPTWNGYPVTGIVNGAFEGEAITSLMLPAYIEDISADTFSGADELCWIGVPANCSNYSVINGVLYNTDGTELIYYPRDCKNEYFTLPADVTSIGAYAFDGVSQLQTIIFNEGLTDIGEYAFYGCDGLEALELPESILHIEEGAFWNCSELQTVKGAQNCIRIGKNAFAGTGFCIFYGDEESALVRYAIANSRPYNIYTVTYVLDGEAAATRRVRSGDKVWNLIVSASEGSVPIAGWYTDENVTQQWDFESMKMPYSDLSLYSQSMAIFVTEDYVPQAAEGAPEAGVRVVKYNGYETDITIPERIDDMPVYTLEASGFAEGSTLYLPGGLLELDVEAFIQASITLYAPVGSATEQLLINAGYNLNIPVHTLTFETNGGRYVNSVQAQAGGTVILPDTVRDDSLFTGWYSDDDLVQYAGEAGGSYEMPDTDVTLFAAWDGEAPEYDFLWEQKENRIIITGSREIGQVTIPEMINSLPVTEIAENAFNGDQTLTSLTLPDGLVSIGSYAFYGTGIHEISLPSTVERVDNYAFTACKNLETVTWSSAAATVGESMFKQDTALTSLILPEGVVSIGANALAGCSAMSSLELPDTVSSIGRSAFRGMTSLRTLMLGAGLTGLSNDALDGCTSLQAIDVPDSNVHYESENGILYYTDKAGVAKYPAGLPAESYTMPDDSILVEAHAFKDAQHLREIILPDDIIQLGEESFANSGLIQMDLSALSSLSSIPDKTFYGCTDLTSAELPEGLLSIGRQAFSGCYSLEELDIPDTVTSIGTDAFDDWVLLIIGENTAAHKYATANGLHFRVRDALVIPAEGIIANKEELTLMVGIPYSMTAEAVPENTTDEITWESCDTNILRVDDGYIRPLKTGDTEVLIWAGDAELAVPVHIVSNPFVMLPESACVFTENKLPLTVQNITDNYPDAKPFLYSEDCVITEDKMISNESTGIVNVTFSAQRGTARTQSYAFIDRSQAVNLPSSMETIGPEAFRYAVDISCVIIPEGTISIEEYAFADCSALEIVYIPESVTTISDTAFNNTPDVTIVCPAGSSADTFAELNNVKCLVIP